MRFLSIRCASVASVLAVASGQLTAQPRIHDRVIVNGRVMDPESGQPLELESS